MYIRDNHRKFYINQELKFAQFYDPNIRDKNLIIQNFLESRDFLTYQKYCNFKVKKTEISEDLKCVYITITEEKENDKQK